MTDHTERLQNAVAERYRIERHLGEGGTATLFVAHDLKHDRPVALKVLRPELAAVVGAERFLAEIKTTANLQHPNILPLFDSGDADGQLFYVMPYVEGESLRDRLDREKQLPVHDAVRIAVEVASALDYAHRQGVIHRDIKPENILLHDGRALVADFGIALALSTAGGTRMTETGMSVGTPTYMSPEQAMGERTVDGRTDMYSLGCVVYEALAGEPPFTGSTAQAIAAQALTATPRPLTARRHTVPAHVEAAVLTALEKLPADRFSTAQAFADALEGSAAASERATREAGRAATTGRWTRTVRDPVVWGLALVALLLAALSFHERTSQPNTGADGVVRFTVDLPAGYQPALESAEGPELAISADGYAVAFPVIDAQGAQRIGVRRLDEGTVHTLPGTEGGYEPSFSPNGQYLAFWEAGRIHRVALSGGAPQLVAEVGAPLSETWSAGGDIVFAPAGVDHLMRVPATGGKPRPAATLDSARGETGQFSPLALPDGRHVLYMSQGHGAMDGARIGLLDLSTGLAHRLNVPGTWPMGVLDGRLVYADQTGAILAVRLDLASAHVVGQPVPLSTGTATSARGSAVAVLAPTGTLAYMAGNREATLMLADAAEATPLLPGARPYSFPRYSPDGKQVAVTIASGTSSDIWLDDVASGKLTRLTSGGTVNERPEWSADGTRVLFRTDRGARSALWWQPADGSGPASPLLADDRADYYEGVMTPDGRNLVYQIDTLGANVMIRPLEGKGAPHAIADKPADEDEARVSPDGHWVAYVTHQPGGPQVVVKSISGKGARVQVSIKGGTEPVWARDDRRLFYRSGGKFRVADVSTRSTFRVLSRKDFMDDRYLASPAPHANYDVSPDGSKLLVLKGEQQRLMVVLDWSAEVEAKLNQKRAS